MKVLNKIKIWMYSQKQYINYLRKIGVKIGDGCFIDKTAFFGSEPWLISIGKNTRIARNCHFVTHDGRIMDIEENE